MVFRAEIHKMDDRIAYREDSDQTASKLIWVKKQSDLSLCCLSMLFWQETSVRNFRTFTVSPDKVGAT